MEERERFPWRDKKERKREVLRQCSIELAQEENLLTTDWGVRSTECHSYFLQTSFGAQTLRFWKYATFSGVELCCTLLGRRELAPECIAQ